MGHFGLTLDILALVAVDILFLSLGAYLFNGIEA
jgi:hypothetical protein